MLEKIASIVYTAELMKLKVRPTFTFLVHFTKLSRLDSRRSQFVYKYMKNVLCLKRMYALQLHSQFFIYTGLFFSKISVLLYKLIAILNFLIVSGKKRVKIIPWLRTSHLKCLIFAFRNILFTSIFFIH